MSSLMANRLIELPSIIQKKKKTVFWYTPSELLPVPISRYKKPELSPFSQKLNYIVTKLKRQITIIRQQIG